MYLWLLVCSNHGGLILICSLGHGLHVSGLMWYGGSRKCQDACSTCGNLVTAFWHLLP